MDLKPRGAVLFETALSVLLLAGILYWGHVQVVVQWQARFRDLEQKRLRYDGENLWKP